MRGRRGHTLVELMLAAAIGSLIILVIARLFSKVYPIFQRINVRNTVLSQSRVCMDTILQALRQGNAGSLVVSTPPGSVVIPNSAVNFNTVAPLASGTTAYGIYLSNQTVYIQEFTQANGPRVPRVLANHVTNLSFTGDSRDPGSVSVSLQVTAPYDNSNKPDHVTTILISNQLTHMVEGP
jgi:hypothetical protein